jgi:hypothetical protein
VTPEHTPGRHTARARSRLFKAGLAVCLLLSAFLVLFPLGWLADVWPEFGRWMGVVFATAWAHAIGHMLIFLLLGLAALAAFPALRLQPRAYFGWLCLAGLLQETLQLLYKQRPIVFDDLRDVVTDLIGLALAFLVVRYLIPLLKPAS